MATTSTTSTRLELRRRLLRIDASSAPVTEPEDALADAVTRLKLSRPRDANDDDDDDDDDDRSDEGEDDDDNEDEEDDDVDDDDDDADASSANQRTRRRDTCATSPVVKLLVSRHGAATVCFEYPAHLGVARAYPSAEPPRVVTVSARDCPLFFQTHWERNCVKDAFAAAGFARTRTRGTAGWHAAWAKHVPKTRFRRLAAAGHARVFNHVPDPWVVGRKDRLLRTLTAHRRRFGAAYAFFPEGFALPEQLDAFRRAVQRDGAAASLWILKPPASACGRGIRVISAPRDVDAIPRDKKLVVHRYVSSPLLLDGFKFDLRLYVLVTSVDPLRIYLFREGIARVCTAPYSLARLRDRFSHLTNYAVNKASGRFAESADADGVGGSKWSLSALLAHLAATGVLRDPAALLAQIRDIVCKTLIAAEAHLTPLAHQFANKPLRCFELFGFDVLLDSSLAPWLIEVNVSPSLMGGSPLDKRVKGLLLSDTFHLVGVPVALSSLPPGALPSHVAPRPKPATPTPTAPAASTHPPLLRRRSSAAKRGAPLPLPPAPRRASARAANKQLHEVVLDPAVPHLEPSHLELFAPSDWDMVHEMDDEMDRLGHFERIFPSPTSPDATAKYAPFFTCQRYANALCAKWVSTQLRNRTRQQQQQTRAQAPEAVPSKR